MPDQKNSDHTKESLLTDIQALLAVKEAYEGDVQKLNNARVSTQGLVDASRQELRSTQQRILSEEEAWKQRKQRDYSSLDSQLRTKEANLNALENQLRTRDAALADLEKLRAGVERKDYDLNSKSLQIEQIRMNLLNQKEKSDSLLHSMELDKAALSDGLKDLEKQRESLRVEHGRNEEFRCVLEKRKEELDIRQQTVADALKGLAPKMKEVSEREKALTESLDKLALDTASIKEREKACEEHEKRLEDRHKVQEELQAQLHAKEVRDRKKGLDLITWEQTLTSKEELLKKREKAISGAKEKVGEAV